MSSNFWRRLTDAFMSEWNKLASWWMFRDLRATDVGLFGSRGRLYLEMHTNARFKTVLQTEMTRAELELLNEIISNELFGEGSPSVSAHCWRGAHEVCEAERVQSRRRGHELCCRTDENKCECDCHAA